MARNSIRVSSGIVPIEVNDAGDTIDLRTDADFMKQCIKMRQNFAQTQEEYEKTLDDENVSAEVVDAAVDKIFTDTDKAIDGLFGEGACKKIFPGNRNVTQYAEFFEQLLTIMENQQSEKAQKYTAGKRTGK